MKNSSFLFIVAIAQFCAVYTANAQFGSIIHISDNPGQTVNTCGSFLGTNFVDSQADTNYIFGIPISSTYGNNENYTKTICSDNGESIQFDFSSFSLGTGDVLNIYDGTSASAPLIASASGTNNPGVVFSTGTCITFVFTSNGSNTGSGWSASISCVEYTSIDEPGNVNTCNSLFFDSGGNSVYGTGEDFVKTVCPGTGSDCIKVTFTEIDIESGIDFLYVYDGDQVNSSALLATITGSNAPQTFYSESGCLTFHFVSDGSGSNQGWAASFSCPELCGVPQCVAGSDPAADECANAPTICDLNGYCGNTSGDYTCDFPGNFCAQGGSTVCGPTGGSSCTLFSGSIENNSWLKFWASETTAQFHIWVPQCESGSGIQMGIYEATNCDGFVIMSNLSYTSSSMSQNDFIISANGLTVGQTYYIMVDGNGGAVCDYVVAAESGVAFGNTITPDQTICETDTAFIEVTGVDTWTWTSNPPDPSLAAQQNSQTITVTPSQTTTYTVQISGNSGSGGWTPPDCNVASTLSSIVNVENCDGCNTPAFNLVSTEPDCYGDPFVVEVDNITLFNNPTYSWSFTGLTLINGNTSTGGPLEFSYSSPSQFTVDLTVTDNNGSMDCTPYTANFVFTVPEILTLNSVVSDETIPSACDGSIDATATGGTTPYTYVWQNGMTSEDISGLCTGVYGLTVTDNNGCTTSSTYTVSGNNCQLTANAVVNNDVSCFGSCDGSVTVNTANANGQVLYAWSNGGTQQTAIMLCAGSYTITVTDQWGCTAIASTPIGQPAELQITALSHTNLTCNNSGDGTVIATESGGTGVLTYSLSGSIQPSGTYNGLNAGSYILIVTDQNGCSENSSLINIAEPEPITINVNNPQNPSCHGYHNGEIHALANGGTGTLIYSIVGFSKPQGVFENLGAGNYAVTVTDQNGCTAICTPVILSEPDMLLITVESATDLSCNNSGDGSIQVLATGGTGQLYYGFQTMVQQIGLFSDLQSGSYFVTVTDENNCTVVSNSLVVEEPDLLEFVTTSASDITCNGDNDGTISVHATGGTGMLSYSLIGNPQNNGSFTHLQEGSYSVTVTDANSCSMVSGVLQVSEPTDIEIYAQSTNATCWGITDGSVEVNISGGTIAFDYHYEWSNGLTSKNIYALSEANYQLTVTDDNGCTSLTNTHIYQPDKLIVASINDTWICQGNTLNLGISTTGGTPPYTYFIDNIPSQQNISMVIEENTTFMMSVIDDAGCIAEEEVNIYVHPSLHLDLFSSDDTICQGDPLEIHAVYWGGDGGPYMLYLHNDASSLTLVTPPHFIYPEESGSYLFELRDNCGTSPAYEIIQVFVSQPPSVTVSTDLSNGCVPLTVHFNESANSNVINFLWDFGDGSMSMEQNPVYEFSDAGVYDIMLTVTSYNGCQTVYDFEEMISVYSLPVAGFVPSPEFTSIIRPEIDFENLSTNYNTCFWDFGDSTSSTELSPTHGYTDIGTYNVMLQAVSQHGCRDTTFGKVNIRDEYTFYAPTAFTPDYSGENDIFFVLGMGIDPEAFRMSIYDRWGEEIFATKNYMPEDPSVYGWNGRVKGNHLASSGVYSWIVNYRDTGGKMHERMGSVTVIR